MRLPGLKVDEESRTGTSDNKMEGDDFIVSKSRTMVRLLNATSMALGAAILAASFFMFRRHRINVKELDALKWRVEELEVDRLFEAYREQGLC